MGSLTERTNPTGEGFLDMNAVAFGWIVTDLAIGIGSGHVNYCNAGEATQTQLLMRYAHTEPGDHARHRGKLPCRHDPIQRTACLL